MDAKPGGLYSRYYSKARAFADLAGAPPEAHAQAQWELDAYGLVELQTFLLEYEVPHVYLSYYRMIVDPDYLYARLAPLLDHYAVQAADFHAAYATISRHSHATLT